MKNLVPVGRRFFSNRRRVAGPPSFARVNADLALDARLAALRRTDEAAWMELLFSSFYEPLGRVIFRVVPDRAVVQDLLQDVLLRVLEGRQQLPEVGSYRAYLTRAALNAALRYAERGRRQVAWDEAPPAAIAVPAPAADDPLAALHQHETQLAVAAALARLSPQARTVFELSRYQDLSYQQIAEQLGLSPKTVENHLGKALKTLRRELAGVLRNLYSVLW